MNKKDTDVAAVQLHAAAIGEVPAAPQALEGEAPRGGSEYVCDRGFIDCLQGKVVPGLLERKYDAEDRLRVWVVGCPSGEEAHYVAILLLEQAAQRPARPHMRVFATDCDSNALEKARLGAYSEQIASVVSQERLNRFFTSRSGSYHVRPEVRDLVVFSSHDLLHDPPYAQIDLIVCRHMFGGLQPAMRSGVLNLFHDALEPGGLLLLGPADDINEPGLFARPLSLQGVYRRRSGRPRRIPLPAPIRVVHHGKRPAHKASMALPEGALDVAAIHRRAVEARAPASVLVNAENHVIHYSRTAGQYVRLPDGMGARSILSLVRDPLCNELRNALEVARRDPQPYRSRWTPLMVEGQPREVSIRVEGVAAVESPALTLVMFEERLPRQHCQPPTGGTEAPEATLLRLEDDLALTSRQLRALATALDVEQQHLNCTRLELHDASDELGSTLQQLEGVREELLVLGQELRTLGQENRLRIRDLAQTSADLQHLLESTGLATLFLDRDLRLVRFTPQTRELFNLMGGDAGRPLSDLAHKLRCNDFEVHARWVLEGLKPLDIELPSYSGRWYLVKIRPYRPAPDRVDGLVIAFIDITERKRVEDLLRDGERLESS
jgi:two-component system CheB/CheR fusion protein